MLCACLKEISNVSVRLGIFVNKIQECSFPQSSLRLDAESALSTITLVGQNLFRSKEYGNSPLSSQVQLWCRYKFGLSSVPTQLRTTFTYNSKTDMDSEFDMPAANSSDDNDWEEAPPEPPTVSDPSTVTTRSLQELQSNGQRKIMDIVDRLRRTGLSGVVSLPQLVVCGDQSSGKSSVLEAITEIPFPRKENLCTRFATEIVLRRASLPSIKITITPDKNRLEDEQKELRLFNKTITDFSQLPAIIEDATVAMGLGEVGAAKSRAFSRDVLTIEICGPDRPQL
jgi:hypothetical protein